MAAATVAGSLTAHDRRILTAVNTGASSLSFVGSGFIVLCYCLFKELRKFSFKLVFYLALSDMLCSFFGIVGDPSKGFFCSAQGYSTHFFCVASFLWTTTIAFTLHRTVVKHKTDVEDFEAMFHLYVWGTSLVTTVIRSFGNDRHLDVWCWTQTGRTGKAVHFITFYAPLWGAILYNGFTYFQVIRMLNNATRMAVGMSDRAYQFDMKALNRWGYYPLILIGSWAFGTINRIHDFIEPGHKIFWLTFLDVGTAALMGLFNSIAYGLNASVRRAIHERLELFWPDRFQRWLPSSSKIQNQQHEEVDTGAPDILSKSKSMSNGFCSSKHRKHVSHRLLLLSVQFLRQIRWVDWLFIVPSNNLNQSKHSLRQRRSKQTIPVGDTDDL